MAKNRHHLNDWQMTAFKLLMLMTFLGQLQFSISPHICIEGKGSFKSLPAEKDSGSLYPIEQ